MNTLFRLNPGVSLAGMLLLCTHAGSQDLSLPAAPIPETFKCTTVQPYHPASGIEITTRVLDDLEYLNPDMIRIEFITEPGGDPVNYAVYDCIVDQFAARDIRVLGLIDYQSAPWKEKTDWATDEFRTVFTARVREIVSHYAKHKTPIRHWEIWNEQDIHEEAFNVRVEPEPYARLLVDAFHAIKSIDPEATVVFGGISPKGFEYEENYLEDFYATQPIREHYEKYGYHPFDVIACHPYPETFKNPRKGLAKVMNERIKAVMNRNHDRHKRVWITELGWSSSAVSEARQADYLTASFELLSMLRDPEFPDDVPYVERYFWFKYDSFSPNDKWGLVPRNRTRQKPAYFAFLNLTPPGSTAPPPPVVPGENSPVWDGDSDADLPVRVSSEDLLQGKTPSLLQGEPVAGAASLARLTNGLFDSGSETVLLADYTSPALRIRYYFETPVDVREVRVFAGHLNDGGYRAFTSTDIYVNGEPGILELNTGTYGQASPETAEGAVSVARWRNDDDSFVAANVKLLDLVFWCTSTFNYDFRDRWSPVQNPDKDKDGGGPAYYAPILKEIDVLGAPHTASP